MSEFDPKWSTLEKLIRAASKYCEKCGAMYGSSGYCWTCNELRPTTHGKALERIEELEKQLAEAKSLHCETIDQRTKLLEKLAKAKELAAGVVEYFETMMGSNCPVDCDCPDKKCIYWLAKKMLKTQ